MESSLVNTFSNKQQIIAGTDLLMLFVFKSEFCWLLASSWDDLGRAADVFRKLAHARCCSLMPVLLFCPKSLLLWNCDFFGGMCGLGSGSTSDCYFNFGRTWIFKNFILTLILAKHWFEIEWVIVLILGWVNGALALNGCCIIWFCSAKQVCLARLSGG